MTAKGMSSLTQGCRDTEEGEMLQQSPVPPGLGNTCLQAQGEALAQRAEPLPPLHAIWSLGPHLAGWA